MQAPAVKAIKEAGALLSDLCKKTAGPIEVGAVCAGSDVFVGHAVAGHGGREPAIFSRVLFGREVAAATPQLVANAPDLYFEGIAARHLTTRTQFGFRG